MTIQLDRPLAWTTPSEEQTALLDTLQGNILDGHGRKSTRHLFLKFDTNPDSARAFVRALAPLLTTAHQQLLEAKRFRDEGVSGETFVAFLLSQSGYEALGVKEKAPTSDVAFTEGMKSRGALLNDPVPSTWDEPYRERVDAMILIGGSPDSDQSWISTEVNNKEAHILALMGNAAIVLGAETGRAIFRDSGTADDGTHKIEGIEHFGYVDGRSQPLLLQELIDREAVESDGTHIWNPAFPISQVLLPDPGAPEGIPAYGSFFVYRKLEQNVRGFKESEAAIGAETGLGELAGAMLVGRFEDGTPVVLQREDGVDNPVVNNFDYGGDLEGRRCPHFAHIRKTNPRGDTVRQFGQGKSPEEQRGLLDLERSRIMARRGMTYGQRDKVVEPTDQPQDGVGLLFMSFQASLESQFEFTQQSWANNVGFLRGQQGGRPATGLDPIIGQSENGSSARLHLPAKWGSAESPLIPTDFASFVTLKGGEYFFAPSKATLSNI